MNDSVQDTLSSLKLQPRLCHLLKWEDFNGYGFNLHAEKGKAGQFIGKVDVGSPAEAAYLQNGDRIIEVNGVNIGNENHQQVVQRIKAGGEETSLLVVDAETDMHFKSQKTVVRGEMPEVAYCKTPDVRGFSIPVMNYNQTLETQQNEETGETTKEIAESAAGTAFITNGLSEDLPAPPPELIENGIETQMENVTVTKTEVISEIESDAIYDIPDAVYAPSSSELYDKVDSESNKTESEKSVSDKQETNSLKADSVNSELDKETNSIQAELEKVGSVKSDIESVQSDVVSVKSDVESVKADIESIKVEQPMSSHFEIGGSEKRVSSILKKIPLDELEPPPSLPETIKSAKAIDVNDPLNFVNVSVEEMRLRLSSKKKINKFREMNLKEKHDLLEKL